MIGDSIHFDRTDDKLFEKSRILDSINNIMPTVKHGGFGMMVWDCMVAAAVGKLAVEDCIIHNHFYFNIFKDNLKESAEKLNCQSPLHFKLTMAQALCLK